MKNYEKYWEKKFPQIQEQFLNYVKQMKSNCELENEINIKKDESDECL